jgi:hypothetical protein
MGKLCTGTTWMFIDLNIQYPTLDTHVIKSDSLLKIR